MKTVDAEIVCTGSELLGGKLNLYVPLFHERLAPLGARIRREQSCGDGLAQIRDCISGALRRARLVIVCGGLGPTFDDLTRQAAAGALRRRIVYSAECEQDLRGRYGLEGALPRNFSDQCLVLSGARRVPNPNGTACGQLIAAGRRLVVLLPGPRREWEPMFEAGLADSIRSFFKAVPCSSVKLRAAGLREPEAEARMKPVMSRFPSLEFTILAGPGTADFIISGDDRRGLVRRAAAAARRAFGPCLYGEGDATLASAAGAALRAAGRTLAGAESCTGGMVSQQLTEAAGSSDYFNGCAVTYSNAAKRALLGVKARTLAAYGAVSEECAAEMASGARKAFASDYAYSVTGIAGPGGGTPEKPVGTVCFAVAGPRGASTFRRHFRGERANVRACAAAFILDELRKIIE